MHISNSNFASILTKWNYSIETTTLETLTVFIDFIIINNLIIYSELVAVINFSYITDIENSTSKINFTTETISNYITELITDYSFYTTIDYTSLVTEQNYFTETATIEITSTIAESTVIDTEYITETSNISTFVTDTSFFISTTSISFTQFNTETLTITSNSCSTIPCLTETVKISVNSTVMVNSQVNVTSTDSPVFTIYNSESVIKSQTIDKTISETYISTESVSIKICTFTSTACIDNTMTSEPLLFNSIQKPIQTEDKIVNKPNNKILKKAKNRKIRQFERY